MIVKGFAVLVKLILPLVVFVALNPETAFANVKIVPVVLDVVNVPADEVNTPAAVCVILPLEAVKLMPEGALIPVTVPIPSVRDPTDMAPLLVKARDPDVKVPTIVGIAFAEFKTALPLVALTISPVAVIAPVWEMLGAVKRRMALGTEGGAHT